MQAMTVAARVYAILSPVADYKLLCVGVRYVGVVSVQLSQSGGVISEGWLVSPACFLLLWRGSLGPAAHFCVSVVCYAVCLQRPCLTCCSTPVWPR